MIGGQGTSPQEPPPASPTEAAPPSPPTLTSGVPASAPESIGPSTISSPPSLRPASTMLGSEPGASLCPASGTLASPLFDEPPVPVLGLPAAPSSPPSLTV